MWDPRGEVGGGNTENTERPCAPHTGQAIPNVLRSLDLLPGSEAGPWGRCRPQGLTSGPERAPPGPPFQADTWPDPSWSPARPPEKQSRVMRSSVPSMDAPALHAWDGTAWGSPGGGQAGQGQWAPLT